MGKIEADCYRRLGYASSPAADVTTRIRAYINDTHRELITLPGMDRLRDGATTFASVASTPTYALPQAIAKVKFIREITNDVPLDEWDLPRYRYMDPDPSDHSGTPEAWVNLGFTAVATQPSNASEIFVDSTDAGDTGTCYIEVVRTGGYRRTLSVTMTGTTAVSLGAAITDVVEITKFYISAAAVGTVTLHEDASGGTELARIPIGATSAKYLLIALEPTPSAAITYYVDYQRVISDLANANDEPTLPSDFHDLLALGARMKEYEKRDDSRYASTQKQYEKRENEFKFYMWGSSTWVPRVGRQPTRTSRLGAQYPMV